MSPVGAVPAMEEEALTARSLGRSVKKVNRVRN
jgi:hypothetical protein